MTILLLMSGEGSSIPPYVSFKTFKNKICEWGDKGQLPSRVDNSLLSSMSGSAQSQFLSALRFFELIDESAAPTAALQSLSSDATKFGTHFKPLIQAHYTQEQLTQLRTGSPAALAESFDKIGSVGKKVCRFLINAAVDAELEVSPHLVDESGRVRGHTTTRSKRKTPRKPRAHEVPTEDAPTQQSSGHPSAPDSGTQKWPLLLPRDRSAELSWPTDMSAEDVKIMWDQLTPLKAMLEARAKARVAENQSE